jgi:hypothetical protein
MNGLPCREHAASTVEVAVDGGRAGRTDPVTGYELPPPRPNDVATSAAIAAATSSPGNAAVAALACSCLLDHAGVGSFD